MTKLPSEDWAHNWPSFLPDGRRFLFTAKLWTRTAEASDQGIYLGSLDSPTIERLLPDLSSAVYAPPGYLVFAREGMVTAAPFDLAAGRVTGPPVAIGGAVATDAQFYFAAISASADGTLAVRPPPARCWSSPIPTRSMRNCTWSIAAADSAACQARGCSQYLMALNPVNSHMLATSILDPRTGTQDLWLMDLAKDSLEPLTATRGFSGEPGLVRRRQAPGLLPSNLPEGWTTCTSKDIGTGRIQPLIETPKIGEHPAAWSHDGKSLLVFTYDDKATYLSSWSFASRTLTRFVGPRRPRKRRVLAPGRLRGLHLTGVWST